MSILHCVDFRYWWSNERPLQSFPIATDGGRGYIYLNITPSGKGKVMLKDDIYPPIDIELASLRTSNQAQSMCFTNSKTWA